MTTTITAMQARQKFGEILNRVKLVNDQFIIEKKGQPYAAIVPIAVLEEQAVRSKKAINKFIDTSDANLSDDEAMKIALEEIRLSRIEQKKLNKTK